MVGIIELENMEFFARHGCFTEERTIGNLFTVNVRMEAEVSAASKSDCLEDAINYQLAYGVIKKEMDVPSNLLEHVSTRIADALYREFSQLKSVTVKVSKINPPVGGRVGCSSVTITK